MDRLPEVDFSNLYWFPLVVFLCHGEDHEQLLPGLVMTPEEKAQFLSRIAALESY
jgi:hypothetical protein